MIVHTNIMPLDHETDTSSLPAHPAVPAGPNLASGAGTRLAPRIVRHGACGLLTLSLLFMGITAMQLSLGLLSAIALGGFAIALLDPRRPFWTLISLGGVVCVRAFAMLVFAMIAWIFGPVAFSFAMAIWSCVAMVVGCGVGMLAARAVRGR